MAGSCGGHNRVRPRRLGRGWSQGELARRAGISRAAVSAVEVGRLVPSVSAALAEALGCSVEELFGGPRSAPDATAWAWPAAREPCRVWRASVGGRVLIYPAEPTSLGVVAHDGVSRGGLDLIDGGPSPEETLVLACCDPAAGLLAAEYARSSGFRLLAFPRSSGQALDLLGRGLVHVAGVHLDGPDDDDGNARAAAEHLAGPSGLLRVARWEEGLALGVGVSARSVRSALRSDLTWVGREPGSGARRCLDQLRPGRPEPPRIAFDHRGVAEAIRCGWAEAGVCLRLAGEEAGLQFLGVQEEGYDLCFPARSEADPRIQALIRVVRSTSYRRLLGGLPGYDAADAGTLRLVPAGAAGSGDGRGIGPGADPEI